MESRRKLGTPRGHEAVMEWLLVLHSSNTSFVDKGTQCEFTQCCQVGDSRFSLKRYMREKTLPFEWTCLRCAGLMLPVCFNVLHHQQCPICEKKCVVTRYSLMIHACAGVWLL